MIVVCDKCKTEYTLDDAKVRPGETKVRCSRCQNIFIVPNPFTLKEEEIFGEAGKKAEDAFLQEWAKEFPAQPTQKRTPPAPERGPAPRAFVPPAAEEGLFVEEPPPQKAPAPEEEALPFKIKPVAAAPARRRQSKVSTTFVLSMLLLLAIFGAFYYWSKMGQSSIPAFEFIYEKIYTFMEGKKEQELFLFYKGNEHSLEGGTVFVVQGTVVNRSQAEKRIVKLKGSLYDKTGKVVATGSGFCGITISDEEIKNSTYDALKASFGFIAVGQAKPVPPQQRLPFTIIFFSPPEGAVNFQVVIDEAPESG